MEALSLIGKHMYNTSLEVPASGFSQYGQSSVVRYPLSHDSDARQYEDRIIYKSKKLMCSLRESNIVICLRPKFHPFPSKQRLLDVLIC